MFRLLLVCSLLALLLTPSNLDLRYAHVIELEPAELSYNRYQAIYFCKQNRWAFCQSWGDLAVTRLA